MAANSASEDKLGELHAKLAETLAEAIEGEPVLDNEGTYVGKKVNSAALNVARQFLKDNNIQCDVGFSKPMKDLIGTLPDFDSNPELINLSNYR